MQVLTAEDMAAQRARHMRGGLDQDGRWSSAAGRPAGSLPAAVLDATQDSVIVMDANGLVLELNRAAERTFGYGRQEALGDELASLIIPPSLRERHRAALRAFDPRHAGLILDRRVELTAMRADGLEFPIELTVTRLAGDPPVFAGFIRDITATRKEVEAKELLARASAAFDSSLDPRQTMRTIANTAVPKLADLCVIDLLREDGVIGESVVAAHDQSTVSRLEDLRARQPLDIAGSHPVARALRAHEPVVVHDLTDERMLQDVAQSEEHRSLIEEAGYRSAVVMKLQARGRLLGALSFLHLRGGAPFDPDHLDLMRDLADRAATALDNAKLYSDSARIAHTLQRSLLPEALPELAGMRLAASFHPVGQAIEVGGDFYDVFQSGAWRWLVVGDVCGKGSEAAALTALVRHSVRALAFADWRPSEVLELVNELMCSHDLAGRFATVIVARLDPPSSTARVEIASAGHPRPLLVGAEGHTRCLEVHGTLLGVFQEIDVEPLEVELERGATLVLYTDGLLEAGWPRRMLTSQELCRLLEGLRGLSPAQIIGQLDEQVLLRTAGRLPDDVAIVAAQVA